MSRCCLCNGVKAKCIRCVCAREGHPCVSCLPLRDGRCHNQCPRVPSSAAAHAQEPVPTAPDTSPSLPSPMAQPPSTVTSLVGSPPRLSAPRETASDAPDVDVDDLPIPTPRPPFLSSRKDPNRSAHCSPASLTPPTSHPFDLAAPQFPSPRPALPPFSASPPCVPPHLPPLNSIFEVKLPTLRHVPKGARNEWAHLLTGLCFNIAHYPSRLVNWQLFFMLPRCILATPVRGGRTHWREVLKLVQSRIRRWKAGEIGELWSAMLEEGSRWSRRRRPKSPTPESQRHSNVRRAKLATEEGQYRKALQALLSEGIATPSSSIVEEMLAKHPQAPVPSIPHDPPPPPPNISHDTVIRAIRSFPAGSAPGPSQLRAAHLKEAILCPSPVRAAQSIGALTSLVQKLSSGQVPAEVTPHLCGATLLACKKKGGGLRPIAVGEVLRRLVSKCLSFVLRQKAVSVLSPLQLGVGVKGGCEAIVHSVSAVLEDSSSPDASWTLLVDFSNAFNCIDRSRMLQEVRAQIPSLSPWMECCYGNHSLLHLQDVSIHSCCGVQQGDPLGPLGFALALQPIIEQISSRVPNLKVNAWYLDDGTLVGSPSDLFQALSIIELEGPTMGLSLNRSKSLLFTSGNINFAFNPLPPDIPRAVEGFGLLGCPVGSPSFCRSFVLKRVEKIGTCLQRLPDLQDSQMESTLLRFCLSLPKISFSLRSCPPDHIREAADSFDTLIRESLADIAGGPLSDWSWEKACLPVSLGGLGLRRASLVAPAAYISSLTEAQPLISAILRSSPSPIHLADAIKDLALAADRPDWDSLQSIDIPIHQRPLSRSIDKACFNLLLSSGPDDRSRALILSTSLPHAGVWLQVIPSSTLGLHLADREFRVSLQYWLGLRMFGEEFTCPVCQRPADVFGDHQVGCGGNSDRIIRHNAICDVVFSAAQSAALCPRKEVPSLIPGSCSRPADIFIPNWVRHQPTALDVTVISPLQQLTLSGASSVAGHALQVAENRKRATHAEHCRSAGVDFVPLVVEALGGWNEDMCSTILSISRLQAQRLGVTTSESFRHLAQRISIALWKGNASLWISRQPIIPAHIDGRR